MLDVLQQDRAAIAAQERRHKQLQHYIAHGLPRVQGWLDRRSARIIAALGQYQTREKISGAVGEIGIHHGKLFILLDLIKTDNEASFAVDLFEQQELNVDHSGLGDYEQFIRNLAELSSGTERVSIIKKNSLELDADEIRALCGPARLFSIDGGHTAACTLNDIRLSEASTIDDAIVIIDDYFNPMWPDVSVGVAEYVFEPGSTLRPFAISPNKLYLARRHCHARYRTALRQQVHRFYQKSSAMYGHDVDIYGYDASSSWQRRLINYVKKSPIGSPLQQVYRHYRA